jgi:hypothetical protein
MGEVARQTPAQAELRPTCAGAFRVILTCDVSPQEFSGDWSTNPIGGDVMGEVARQTPAQAELRPTCAGAFCVILTCDVSL